MFKNRTDLENLVNNRKFGQKSKILSKIDNLVKNRIFGKNRKFCKRSKKW